MPLHDNEGLKNIRKPIPPSGPRSDIGPFPAIGGPFDRCPAASETSGLGRHRASQGKGWVPGPTRAACGGARNRGTASRFVDRRPRPAESSRNKAGAQEKQALKTASGRLLSHLSCRAGRLTFNACPCIISRAEQWR